MRGFAYAIAALAAIGIAIGIAGTSPNTPTADQDPTAAPTLASTTPEVMAEAGTLTLAVPDMHCTVSCFPRVKKTLEDNPAVAEVVLGPQKEEGIIDNRQVIVQYQPGFNLSNALGALVTEGFTETEVVQ